MLEADIQCRVQYSEWVMHTNKRSVSSSLHYHWRWRKPGRIGNRVSMLSGVWFLFTTKDVTWKMDDHDWENPILMKLIRVLMLTLQDDRTSATLFRIPWSQFWPWDSGHKEQDTCILRMASQRRWLRCRSWFGLVVQQILELFWGTIGGYNWGTILYLIEVLLTEQSLHLPMIQSLLPIYA